MRPWRAPVTGGREEALRAVGYRRLHRPPDDAGGDEHAGPASAARMIERHVAGPGFQWFVERPRGRGRGGKTRTDLIEATPVGLLPAETATRDGGRLPQSCACSRWWRTSRRRTISGVLDRDIPRLPEILRAEPRLGRVQKGTGKRWEFDPRRDRGRGAAAGAGGDRGAEGRRPAAADLGARHPQVKRPRPTDAGRGRCPASGAPAPAAVENGHGNQIPAFFGPGPGSAMFSWIRTGRRQHSRFPPFWSKRPSAAVVW